LDTLPVTAQRPVDTAAAVVVDMEATRADMEVVVVDSVVDVKADRHVTPAAVMATCLVCSPLPNPKTPSNKAR